MDTSRVASDDVFAPSPGFEDRIVTDAGGVDTIDFSAIDVSTGFRFPVHMPIEHRMAGRWTTCSPSTSGASLPAGVTIDGRCGHRHVRRQRVNGRRIDYTFVLPIDCRRSGCPREGRLSALLQPRWMPTATSNRGSRLRYFNVMAPVGQAAAQARAADPRASSRVTPGGGPMRVSRLRPRNARPWASAASRAS